MRGTLQALAFCHERSVAHGSMGSGSILLSTYDDRRANDLIVKLDNFGFGRAHYACSLDLRGGVVSLHGSGTLGIGLKQLLSVRWVLPVSSTVHQFIGQFQFLLAE